MHPRLQAKLLRAIQEKVIDRVGGSQSVKVDIRILATSNRDMLQSVKDGDFREDLYFRLNVVNLDLPPLRKRPKDIEALSLYFSHKYSEMNHLPKKTVGQGALDLLKGHSWPGNVRELENTLHRAVLFAEEEELKPQDFIGLEGSSEDATDLTPVTTDNLVGQTVSQVEKKLILDTVDHCLGNRTHAANILGISIRTLRNKLKEYSSDSDAIPSAAKA